MDRVLKNKDQVLRYLGYRSQTLDKVTNDLIEESINEMRDLIKPRYVYKFFNIMRKEEGMYLSHSNFNLVGENIKNHLAKSEVCALMAVTIGNNVDTKIRYYEKINMTKALILDACATATIEEICGNVCKELKEIVNRENKVLTSRYSPGYGDLPIDIQKSFLDILDAGNTIGLTVSSHNILIPRKSVTAIVGIIEKEDKNTEEISCLNCNKYDSCIFRKGDDKCGN